MTDGSPQIDINTSLSLSAFFLITSLYMLFNGNIAWVSRQLDADAPLSIILCLHAISWYYFLFFVKEKKNRVTISWLFNM